MRTLAVVVLGCLAASFTFAADAGEYPDQTLTPGATLDVTRDDICVVGYTKRIRNVPIEVKRRVYDSYGIRYVPRTYEVDHLIPLELGGSNSIRNLWPEPYDIEWNAHVKDRLENRLHYLVCEGALSLDTAQRAIGKDWIAAYQQYMRGNHKSRDRYHRRSEYGY